MLWCMDLIIPHIDIYQTHTKYQETVGIISGYLSVCGCCQLSVVGLFLKGKVGGERRASAKERVRKCEGLNDQDVDGDAIWLGGSAAQAPPPRSHV